jgi:hypothetical protein
MADLKYCTLYGKHRSKKRNDELPFTSLAFLGKRRNNSLPTISNQIVSKQLNIVENKGKTRPFLTTKLLLSRQKKRRAGSLDLESL